MAIDPSYFFYSDGTITLTNGSDLATGQFVAWDPALLPFDFVFPNDGTAGATVIKEVLAVNQIRLAKPWTGPTLTDVPYFALRFANHTDPRFYAVRVSEYLARLKMIPDNLEEIGQQVSTDAAAVASALTAITQAAADVEADRQAVDAAVSVIEQDRQEVVTLHDETLAARDTAVSAAGATLSLRDTRAAAAAATIPVEATYLRTAGYAAVGDGGAALYKRLSAAPGTVDPRYFQSQGGAWWEHSGVAVDIREIGADPAGGGDIGPILQALINNGKVPVIRQGVFRWQTTVNIPEGRRVFIEGSGDARVVTTADTVLLDYNRVTGSTASSSELFLRNIYAEKQGGPQTSTFLRARGYDVTFDDNWVHVDGGQFRGFNRAFWLKHCAGRFSRFFAPFNNSTFFFERNASFITMKDILMLQGQYGIYADDNTFDGISNTIVMHNVVAVHHSNTDYRILGWDAVHMTDCGADLGGSSLGAGQSAIYLGGCTNSKITGTWIASNNAGGASGAQANRRGIWLENSRHIHITNCSIKNNAIGIFSQNPNGLSAKLFYTGIDFENNRLNHIYVANSKVGVIGDCMFDNTPPRTGDSYEMYLNTAGTSHWSVRRNQWKGAAVTLAGDASNVIDAQMFNCPI